MLEIPVIVSATIFLKCLQIPLSLIYHKLVIRIYLN